MKIYNITFIIEPQLEEEWLSWAKQIHIKEIMASGVFKSARLTKVLGQKETLSYSVQFFTEDKDGVEYYLENYAPKLKHEVMKRFLNKVLFFETELDYIEDFYINKN